MGSRSSNWRKLLSLVQRFRIKLSFIATVVASVSRPDRWRNLSECDVLLIRHDGDCGYRHSGRAYAQLVNSFGDLCGQRGLTTQSVAPPYSVLLGEAAYDGAVAYNRAALRIAFLGRIVRLLGGKARGVAWANARRYELWCEILEITRPSLVLTVMPDTWLCLAGKTKHIPVMDLQHGVIAREHYWYGKRFRENTPPAELPDAFLCWDDRSAEVLREWAPQKDIAVRVVGNPWFSRFLFQRPDDEVVAEVSSARRIFLESKPVVLHSMAWGMEMYYQYPGFNQFIVDSLEQAILQTAHEFNWILRLHPYQLAGPEREHALKYLEETFGHLGSVEWIRSSSLPLPLILQQSDAHITDLSSIVIEAGWFGIRSAVLNTRFTPGGDYERLYEYERERGLMDVVPQNSAAIVRWLRTALERGRGQSTLVDASRNMEALLGEIGAHRDGRAAKSSERMAAAR